MGTFTEPSGRRFSVNASYIATYLFCNGLTAQFLTPPTLRTLSTLPWAVKIPSTLSIACVASMRPSSRGRRYTEKLSSVLWPLQPN